MNWRIKDISLNLQLKGNTADIHVLGVRSKAKFNDWLTGPACTRLATGLERKAVFEDRWNRKAKAQRIAKEEFIIYDSGSEEEESRQVHIDRTLSAPTKEDADEVAHLNDPNSNSINNNATQATQPSNPNPTTTKTPEEQIENVLDLEIRERDFFNNLKQKVACFLK